MDAASAEEAARRRLGNATLIREEIYRMNSLQVFENCGRICGTELGCSPRTGASLRSP